MSITRTFAQKAILAIALTAMTGTAIAQSGPIKPGPMPPEITKMGDKEAVCFLASTMAAAKVQAAIETAPVETRDGAIELSWRQMAFYMGKISAKFSEPQASEQVTAASRSFVAGGEKLDRRPIVQWCFRTYLEDATAFQTRLTNARKLATSGSGANLAAISVDAVDEDALCFALVGIALPTTMEAAKTNPSAAAGVKLLGRTQHFYMGRLLAKSHKVSIDQSIADAWSYTAALSRANDNATANAKVNACANRFKQINPGFFQAAQKGLPEGR